MYQKFRLQIVTKTVLVYRLCRLFPYPIRVLGMWKLVLLERSRLDSLISVSPGYSIIEKPKPHGKSYNKWLGDTAGLSHREIICRAIDVALTQKPASFEDLLKGLEQMGYQVKRGKVPSLLGGTQKRFII